MKTNHSMANIKSYFKLLFILMTFTSNVLHSQDTSFRVYKFDIKEEIAPPVWHHTQKAFSEAEELNFDLIIIHMNTYGGMLDAADSIRTAILKSDIPVYVFIDNNAASAGALISIAIVYTCIREQISELRP